MRSNISSSCGLSNQPYSLAVISYDCASDGSAGNTTSPSKTAVTRVTNSTGAITTTQVVKKPSSTAWPFIDNYKCDNVGYSMTVSKADADFF